LSQPRTAVVTENFFATMADPAAASECFDKNAEEE
jgi:hypothetical protein